MNLSQRINKSPFWRTGVVAIPAILFTFFLLIKSHYDSRKFIKTILKHYQFSSGEISNYIVATKQTGGVTYFFKVDGSYIKGAYGSGQFKNLDSRMYTKSFPVIYNVEEPQEFNEILVFPDQFDKYHLEFPDSLFWVKKLLK